jgi:hypothetical protein
MGNMWQTIDTKPIENSKVFAVCRTESNKMYNLMAYGWFRDTIYACRFEEDNYIIESLGQRFPATHWQYQMELPEW